MPKEVLIVEDDRTLSRSLARAVEKLGYSAREVHDGAAALEAVGKQRPDALLIDLLLPKRDGQTVVRTLLQSETTKDLPVLAMSGVFRGTKASRELASLGARVLLEKPFSARDLATHLRDAIGTPERDEAPDTDKSDLSQTPAAELIWGAVRDRFTGALHFNDAKRKKVLVFEEGRPRLVRSNLAKETLGRRLFNSGRIDDRAYKEAQRRAKTTGQRQGGLLVELGAISKADLDRALEDQAREKLLELLTWTEGESWRQDGVRSISLATELTSWTGKKMILTGAAQIPAPVARTRLGGKVDQEVALDEGVLGEDRGARAGPVQALVEALQGEKRVGPLLDAHASALYALSLVGAALLHAPGRPPKRAAHPSAAAEVGESGGVLGELQARSRAMQDEDHFQVLGVERDADEGAIRKAFVALAKLYHPDKLSGESAGVRAVASEIFARVTAAHEVLIQPAERRKYLKALEKGGAKGDAKRKVARIMTAEQQFQKASDLIRRREFAEGIQALHWALELDPEEGEFHALLGWATFLNNPGDEAQRAQAYEHMRKGVSLAPKSPSGYFYLAKFYKACEDSAEAERMFRKVVEIRPGHREAMQELRLFEMRRGKGDAGTRTRFGLGRKK